ADDAVIVGVEPREVLHRPREEFVARDRAVIVCVDAGEMIAAAHAGTTTPAMRAALGAHFFARQLTIIVGVELAELRQARRIEFLTGQHAVIVRVALPQPRSAALRRL